MANNYELYHHGVKGMKWGVRRTPEQLGYKTNKEVKKLSETYAGSHREYVTYRALKSERDRGRINVSDEQLSFLGSSAAAGLKWCSNYTNKLRKKGFEVDIRPEYEDDGRQYITTILKDKLGNTYMHEIYSGVKAYGDYLYPESV